MSGVGVYGGYQQPTIIIGGPGGGVIQPLPYPPGPFTWPAGQTWPMRGNSRVYALDLNQQLSEAVAFLNRKPMFQGAQTQGNQSISPNTWTPVTLDTEIADPWGMHSNNSDTSQIVIPYACDGIWLVQGTVPYAAGISGNFMYACSVEHNGSLMSQGEYITAPNVHVSPGTADLIAASQGDTFQLAGFHTFSSSVNTYIATPTPGNRFADNVNPLFTGRWVTANNSVPGGVIQVPVPVGNGFYQNQPVTLTLPNPGTWTSPQLSTAAQFNSDIRNSVLFLANVPACRFSVTGSPAAITSGTTPQQITGQTAQIDNWSAFASNTWTCPIGGLYLVGGVAAYGSAGSSFSTSAYIHAVQSSVTTNYTGAGSFSYFNQSMVLRTLRFTAGDTVQLYTTQNSGSSMTPSGNSRLFTLWLSS